MTPEQGLRLREERKRLGLTQADMGVAPKTQRFYESGERSPDVAYLTAFAVKGADLLYVLQGMRSAETLSDEEARLLTAWRGASEEIQQVVMAALGSRGGGR